MKSETHNEATKTETRKMKMKSRKQETKEVKATLKNLGINARVGHGSGTSYGWLYINIGRGNGFGEHNKDPLDAYGRCLHGECLPCKLNNALAQIIEEIVLVSTGRKGLYHENVAVHTSDTEIAQSITVEKMTALAITYGVKGTAMDLMGVTDMREEYTEADAENFALWA